MGTSDDGRNEPAVLRFPGRKTKDRQFPDANGTPNSSAPTAHDFTSRRVGTGPSLAELELAHSRLMADLGKLELDRLLARAAHTD
jgi:hypothetical protein